MKDCNAEITIEFVVSAAEGALNGNKYFTGTEIKETN